MGSRDLTLRGGLRLLGWRQGKTRTTWQTCRMGLGGGWGLEEGFLEEMWVWGMWEEEGEIKMWVRGMGEG